MARLRQVAIVAGRVAGPQLGGVLGKGGVADMVQGLDLPVAADEFGELGRGGLLDGQAGDGVDRFEGGLASLAVRAPTLDLDGLAGSGEEEAVHGGGLDPADLGAGRGRCPGCGPCSGISFQRRDLSWRRFFWLPLTITM